MALYAPHRHDIVLQNPDGEFVAVIEFYNVPNLSSERATLARSSSMKYTLLPQTPYFLLLSQERGYLWKDAWSEGPGTPPTHAFSMDNVMARYLKRDLDERLSDLELESLALRWLNDLADGKQKASEEPDMTLAMAGFSEAIRDARVSMGEEP